jgi:SOS-response transcriptional repressor LexA
VQGDAMTAPSGNSKSFHEGDLIIVDPDKIAAHNNYVIAIPPRAKEATFKQYVVDGGVSYLKPLNPQYPMIQINDATHVCGVVVNCLGIIC